MGRKKQIIPPPVPKTGTVGGTEQLPVSVCLWSDGPFKGFHVFFYEKSHLEYKEQRGTSDERRRPTSAQKLAALLLQPPFPTTNHREDTQQLAAGSSSLQYHRRETANGGGLRFAVLPQGSAFFSRPSSHSYVYTYPSERGKYEGRGGKRAVEL